MYHKSIFSRLYLKWDSFVPKEYKRGLVNCLVHRAWKICSSYEYFHQELDYIKDTLTSNGYPVNYVDSCINNFLKKQFQISDNMNIFGPEKKVVFLSLPYIGIQSIKLKRQLHRVIDKVAPCIKLNVVFVPLCKLNRLCKLKCKIPLLCKSGLVYKVRCSECNEFYVCFNNTSTKTKAN